MAGSPAIYVVNYRLSLFLGELEGDPYHFSL